MESGTTSEALPQKTNNSIDNINLNINQLNTGPNREENSEDKDNLKLPNPMIPDKPKETEVDKRADKLITCKSTMATCRFLVLKGFDFCHKHILEDKASPYQRCSFFSKEDNKGCPNPAPKNEEGGSFCLHHEKQKEKHEKLKKNRDKKSSITKKAKRTVSGNNIRPSSRKSTPIQSSSGEDEYSFITDSTQVDKIACTWLGNQASDADSTDSEDENCLNHAGTWTLEECVKICKEKMERLRMLYMLQYKRLAHNLKEDRRKMVANYDMDPCTLLQVGFPRKTGDLYKDFIDDMHLTNYQKLSGAESLAEKQMKEKRNHGKKSDLPRCHNIENGIRCSFKVLPFSKNCLNHICSDPEQYLFEQCINKDEKDDLRCTKPAWILHETCQKHTVLECSKTKHLMSGIEVAKKAKEARKRKLDQTKLERKDEKKDIVNRSSRRTSRNREESLRSPQHDTVHHNPKIQILDGSFVSNIDLSSTHCVKLEDTSEDIQNVPNIPKLDHSTAEMKNPLESDTKIVFEKSNLN